MEHQAFLRALESHALPAEQFNHQAHLRAAWAYRRSYSAREAAARCARALSRFAMAKGAPEKYHHTLTLAFITIIYSRLEQFPAQVQDWQTFMAANSDLQHDACALIGQYYSEQKLQDDSARRRFVAPDLAPLPLSCLTH